MADQVRPPTPWKWDDEDRHLRDAHGDVLARATMTPGCDPEVEFDSPYVRAVTEAAGELEAKLRDLALRAGALLEQTYVDLGPVPTDDEDLVAILACEELLSRIDKRAKGG